MDDMNENLLARAEAFLRYALSKALDGLEAYDRGQAGTDWLKNNYGTEDELTRRVAMIVPVLREVAEEPEKE